MVGGDGNPSPYNYGRLEFYHNGKWGTVCNKGWNDMSAKVACKMLDFKDGKAIGEPADSG